MKGMENNCVMRCFRLLHKISLNGSYHMGDTGVHENIALKMFRNWM